MNMSLRRLAFIVVPLLFSPALLWAAATSIYPAHPQTSADILAADVMARDRAISDDAFQGRGPGTRNGEAAAQWIADEMKRIGLKPGNNGSYFQKVPSVTIALDAAHSSLAFNTPQGAITPHFPDDAVYWTPQFAGPDVSVAKAPLVFVGYGVVAPEYHWDDYAGIDVKGKTVVILINDPGNEARPGDPAFFKGKAMTYYGRWTYKFEEAARHGAAAAIIVHETGPAAYGWQVVRNSNSGNKLWLAAADQDKSMVPIQGWITLDTARDLFKRAGLDYDAQKAAANKPGFAAVAMSGETLDAHAHSSVAHLDTRNVVGVIPGRTRPGEYILYTAHWDHLGIKPDVAGPDKIYNGAIDNGMGVSSVLEIGEAFAHARPGPQRSIAIICWSLEEQGLLGSQYFAAHPIWPLSHIVGGVNLDGGSTGGHAHDLVLIGNGASEMEDMLADVLKTQDRTIAPDPEPEKGGFYRSDHISLSRVGVPMLDPAGGYDMVVGGKARGQAIRDDYRANHYHQPSDEFNPSWDVSGQIDDLLALYTLGDTLANSDRWPNWYKDNEFRAIRDKSLAGRK
ncbi:MAG TPA: M28 family peptidase [Rhizomicrobium sp.]|jgi:Zn-dependent M28 family amino/carboxypeptidase|nr:M28 family peptidase [Rhizomicrobium sp.]